jgi:hypothetical protein
LSGLFVLDREVDVRALYRYYVYTHRPQQR